MTESRFPSLPRLFIDLATYLGFIALVLCAGGQSDFKEYWGAFHLISGGGNPYDPQAMFDLQRSIEPSLAKPLMMWNTPWLPLVFSPILHLPYELSRFLWLCSSCLMLYLSLHMTTRLVGAKQSLPHIVYLCVLGYPVMECLRLGQMGCILLLALCTSWNFANKGKHLTAGLIFALLGAKPHLFIILGVLLLLASVRNGWNGLKASWNPQFLVGAIFGTLCLWSLAVAVSPALPIQWYSAVTGTFAGPPPAYLWRTATPASIIKELLGIEKKAGQLILLWLPCVAGIAGAVIWKLRTYLRSRMPNQPIRELIPTWTALSVALSPFAWPFDFVVLLPLTVSAMHAAGSRAVSIRAIDFLLLLQIASLGSLWIAGEYFGPWWYPAALLVWVVLARRRSSAHE